ncbi:MAG: 3-dehydroquinate dehydratase [Lachnospiraceae bacterium]|nr:3-dehydroquinate dehydratase [Lachnospiraceae bacterium]
MKLLVINGPSLGSLGTREVEIFGKKNYDYLCQQIAKKAAESEILVEIYQSNHEGDIIDRIHQSFEDGTTGIIINPAAYAHYSYCIYDALMSVPIPKVQVHIADLDKRAEEWRHTNVIGPACNEVIMGRGYDGYIDAIDYMIRNKAEYTAMDILKAQEESESCDMSDKERLKAAEAEKEAAERKKSIEK